MKTSYRDLIEQTYDFPQRGFELVEGQLNFHGIPLLDLIKKYGTPFRLLFLPSINQQIQRAQAWFQSAFEKHDYQGDYFYCYCTKCSHFAPVIRQALQETIHIETSSAYDIDLIRALRKDNQISYDTILIHNGYKTAAYLEKIISLINEGYENCVIILDSTQELERIKQFDLPIDTKLKLGIRMAINEEPQSVYYTSRLGIPESEIIPFFKKEIANDPRFELKMLHFYVDSGIKDNLYYWGEFQRAMNIYTSLAKLTPNLSSLNLGGGFPIRNKLNSSYDYKDIVSQIVENIKGSCEEAGIAHPNLFTEFGKYTVGESGATIFSVLEQKKQNDNERWYMIDNSLMNTIPDAWSLMERFILLPINKWDNSYHTINIGGISCDSNDYYNFEAMNQQIMLPKFEKAESEPLYIGFFHTGAYQDAISGYGGIKHCLIPSPKYILIHEDENGNLIDELYSQEQGVNEMLNILGYRC